MLPIGDDNSDRHRRPLLTTLLIVANVLVFLYELSIGQASPRRLAAFVHQWGVVPREYALGTDLPPLIDGPYWLTLGTSMFLHGGWGHLLGNMLYLWIFGDNVEDRFGRLPFLLLYLATGVVGALAQIAVNPGSTVPTVGASAAISGILGAYLALFPRKRVHVLFFFFILSVPAIVVIGLWILTQLMNGFGQVALTEETGGVAYMAHVGGFASGLLAGLVIRAFATRSGGPRGASVRRAVPWRATRESGPYRPW
jgi:membrane associated rhomboid family serine protease